MKRISKKFLKKNRLYFSPINGQTFKVISQRLNLKDIPNSIIFYKEETNEIFFKSLALIMSFKFLNQPWKFFGLFLSFLPKKILDFLYSCIARNRHLIFKNDPSFFKKIPAEYAIFFKK